MKTGRGLEDLMNHLFASAESLADPKTTDDERKEEIERAKIPIPTAKTIIGCATLSPDATRFVAEHSYGTNAPALPQSFSGEAAPKARTNGTDRTPASR